MTARVENCKRCNKHVDECGPLSKRKLCIECSEQRQRDAIEHVALGRGELHDKWIVGMERATERVRLNTQRRNDN